MIVHRKNQLPVFCLKLGSVVELAESDPCEKMPFSMLSHLWAVNGKPFDIISCFFRLWNAHYLFPMSICCEQKGRIPHPHQVKFIAIPRGKPSPWEEHVESSSVQWALLQFCVGEGTLRRERLLFLHINGKDGSQISSVEIVWMRKNPTFPNLSIQILALRVKTAMAVPTLSTKCLVSWNFVTLSRPSLCFGGFSVTLVDWLEKWIH